MDRTIDYCSEFCNNIGIAYDPNSIRLTALTGSAAANIRGDTIHRVAHLRGKQSDPSEEDEEDWKNTRLLIIDEISFAAYEEVLVKLSTFLQKVTNTRDMLYGKMNVVFIGDFAQLEAITKDKLPDRIDGLYWERELNLMIELQGRHRFRDCTAMGDALATFRDTGLDAESRKMFNSRVIGSAQTDGTTVDMPNVLDTKIAVFSNKTKELYNESIFMMYLKQFHSKNENDPIPLSAVVIKAGLKWSHNRKPLSFSERSKFYEYATEDNTRPVGQSTRRVAPLLKLFEGCEVMTLDNIDVKNGIANGTTAKFRKILLKEGVEMHKVCYSGYWIHSVHVHEIENVLLEWTPDSLFQGTFCVKPQTVKCSTDFKVREFGRYQQMSSKTTITQFPITMNQATTVHKLQGKSLDRLLIAEWGSMKNWVYVVLSRVRTLEGLFLLKPIPDNADVQPGSNIRGMMDRLRNNVSDGQSFEAIQTIRNEVFRMLSSVAIV